MIYISVCFCWVVLITRFVEAVMFYQLFQKIPLYKQHISILGTQDRVELQVLPKTKEKSK